MKPIKVEVKRREIPHLCSFGRYLYVVRITQRKCEGMDFYVDDVYDFGAYESDDMAQAVKQAIEKGEIIIK